MRDDDVHPRAKDGNGRVFPGGSATEVALRHQNVAGADALDPIVLQPFHAVRPESFGVCGHEETGRDDGVGINMFADFVNSAFVMHVALLPAYSAAGEVMTPATAEAAAT